MFTTQETFVISGILIFCILFVLLLHVIYQDAVHQDLIDHKIIMHDPTTTTGKLIYTSDKSQFNY